MKPTPLTFLVVLSSLAVAPLAAKNLSDPLPPALPRPVSSFGATVDGDGSVYIYGGHQGERHEYHREDVNGSLCRWQAGEPNWEEVAVGEPAQGATLVATEGGILRVGGMAAHNAPEEEADLWSVDSVTLFERGMREGRELPKMPARRSSHDSVVVGSTLHVFGGWSLEGGSGRGKSRWHETYLTLDLAAPEEGWQEHPQPFVLRAIATATDGRKVWVMGGMDDANDISHEVHVLDTETGEWSRGPDLPEHKLGGFGFSAVGVGDRVFANGAEGVLLELRDSAWVPVLRLAHPRYFHRLLAVEGGKLLAIGGESLKQEKAPPEWILLPEKGSAPLVASVTRGTDERGGQELAAAKVSASWPKFQGPRGDGTTPNVSWSSSWPSQGPREAWRAEVGLGLASFAVAEGRAYTAGNNGQDLDTFSCIDVASGATLWTQEMEVPTKCHAMPIVPYGPAATPTVVEGMVYHVSRAGDVMAFDGETGDLKWRRHMVSDFGGTVPVYGYSSSPAYFRGRLFLDVGQDKPGSNSGSTVCLDAADGSLVWQAGEGQAGYATPFVRETAGRMELVLFKGEAFEIRNPHDGVLWSRFATTTRDFCNCATPVPYAGGFFISHTGDSGSTGLEWDGQSLVVKWNERGLGLLFNSGLPWRGRLLLFNEENRKANELRLIDLATGSTVWQTEEIPKGNGLLCDDGRALFLSREGELIAARILETGVELLDRVQALGGKTYIQPVLAGSHVLCRNNDGAVVCYDLAVDSEGT